MPTNQTQSFNNNSYPETYYLTMRLFIISLIITYHYLAANTLCAGFKTIILCSLPNIIKVWKLIYSAVFKAPIEKRPIDWILGWLKFTSRAAVN